MQPQTCAWAAFARACRSLLREPERAAGPGWAHGVIRTVGCRGCAEGDHGTWGRPSLR